MRPGERSNGVNALVALVAKADLVIVAPYVRLRSTHCARASGLSWFNRWCSVHRYPLLTVFNGCLYL